MVLIGSFQQWFLCNNVSIVSGAVAERIKIWPFFAFAVIMSLELFIQFQWVGNGEVVGYSAAGFSDFAGSTLVHACWWCSRFSWCNCLGAREGRFTQ